MFYKPALEETAAELREILEINSDAILNPSYFAELCEKLKTYFGYFDIKVNQYDTGLLLENEKFFTIYLCGNDEKKFYDLVQMFTFAILLDKKSLTSYELQRKMFEFPRLSDNGGDDEYLMRAFMMPQKAFVSAVTQYSPGDGGSIMMYKMQKEVNKYCYQRGRDLQMWT